MDPIEAFDVLFKFIAQTYPRFSKLGPTDKRRFQALLRAVDEMAAHSGQRDRDDQIMTVRSEQLGRVREIMSEVGL